MVHVTCPPNLEWITPVPFPSIDCASYFVKLCLKASPRFATTPYPNAAMFDVHGGCVLRITIGSSNFALRLPQKRVNPGWKRHLRPGKNGWGG